MKKLLWPASIMDHSVFWNLNSRCLKRKFKPTFLNNLTGYQNVPYFCGYKCFKASKTHFLWVL